MTKTLDDIINSRVSNLDGWRPVELIEFAITKRDDLFQLTMGYMIYAHRETMWRPIMTLRHLFKSKNAAEDIIEAIFAKGSVELEHWDSPKDPNQAELLLS